MLRLARRWVRRYLEAKRSGREFYITQATRLLRAALAREGFNRPERGCEGMVERLLKASRRRGMAGWPSRSSG